MYVPLDLNNADFLTTLRATQLRDRGLAVGDDPTNGVTYVAADATFYDLEVYLPTTGSFHSEAVTTTADPATPIRAIINGQVFGDRDPSRFTTDTIWLGEIIHLGQRLVGMTSRNDVDARYLGKWPGRSQHAYDLAKKGRPSDVSPGFYHALGRLLPIIKGKVPFGIGPSVHNTQDEVITYSSPTVTGTLFAEPPETGKVIVAIHRSLQLICFFVQEQGAEPNITMIDLIPRLLAMGIDDAVYTDGGGSASLIVDGMMLATPRWDRRNVIPVGLQLRRQTLKVEWGTTTFEQVWDPILAEKLGPLPFDVGGPWAELSWEPLGLRLTVTTFGGGLTDTDLYLPDLPIICYQQSGTDITQSVVLEAAVDSTVRVLLTITYTADSPSSHGRLIGGFTLYQFDGSPTASATFEWPLI